jgi:hypothetical protein
MFNCIRNIQRLKGLKKFEIRIQLMNSSQKPAMKQFTRSKNLPLTTLLLALSLFLFAVGCKTLSTDQARASQTIGSWVPVGTSREDAIKIMEQHGFTYNPAAASSSESPSDAVFEKKGRVHYWVARFHVEKDKIITSPAVNIFLTSFIET